MVLGGQSIIHLVHNCYSGEYYTNRKNEFPYKRRHFVDPLC